MLLNCASCNLDKPSELLYVGSSLTIEYGSDNVDPKLPQHILMMDRLV